MRARLYKICPVAFITKLFNFFPPGIIRELIRRSVHFTFTKTQGTRGTFWLYHSSYFEFQVQCNLQVVILNFVKEGTEVEIVSEKGAGKPVQSLLMDGRNWSLGCYVIYFTQCSARNETSSKKITQSCSHMREVSEVWGHKLTLFYRLLSFLLSRCSSSGRPKNF